MYSTCLFCHAKLGANGLIERCPVGRRLAFDPGKGRVWVVCTQCGRWNLTPLDGRLEAIDECEHSFRYARPCGATQQIAQGAVGNLELVRVGRPIRAELEGWRYGDAMLRRRGLSVAVTAARRLARGNRTFVQTPDGRVLGLRSRTAPELERLRPEILLSLEMAVVGHREDEVMANALRELEAEWRRAEEIAAIADGLLIPAPITRWLDQHRPTA